MENLEPRIEERQVRVPAGPLTLEGNLSLPEPAQGVVLFALRSGSSRFNPQPTCGADAQPYCNQLRWTRNTCRLRSG